MQSNVFCNSSIPDSSLWKENWPALSYHQSSELNHSRTRKMGARETMQECFISANSKENSTVFKPEIKKFDHDGHKTQLKSSICSVWGDQLLACTWLPSLDLGFFKPKCLLGDHPFSKEGTIKEQFDFSKKIKARVEGRKTRFLIAYLTIFCFTTRPKNWIDGV